MAKSSPKKPPVLNCQTCGGACCKYFALEVDRPRTSEDYDNLRWYIAHENISIFIDKKDWYLQVNTPCRYLTPESQCGIYNRRPKICREYGWNTTEETECHGSEPDNLHDHYFANPEELEAYLIKIGKYPFRRKKKRTPRLKNGGMI